MSKSNYPNKLDTSVEIPVIRDNITEIGSDVLNSLRAAIFNIERTLGINPQGAAGNTVAARLSNVVDENGNILKEALDRSNILHTYIPKLSSLVWKILIRIAEKLAIFPCLFLTPPPNEDNDEPILLN